MSLKAVLKTLEGLDDKVKEHYTEKDGKFVLDVSSVDGLVLENVDGLKASVEALRTSERNLTQDLKNSVEAVKQLETKFDGIDPKAAKSALSKVEEIANWDGDTKIKEAIEINERKMQVKMDELVKQHTEKVETLENDFTDSQDQLQDAIVNSQIVKAISDEKGSVDLLVPHVRKHVNMIKDGKGRWIPEVVNEKGDPRIGDSQGTPMTIPQLVQEMKTKDVFAGAFPGANQSGTGRSGAEEGTHHETGDKKVVNASDNKTVSDNLEDIASGKTKVDMEK